MDDRPKRLADYFLVVGLGDKAELWSENESEDCTDLPYSTCDPITELAIMHKGDKVPEEFKVLTETTNGQSANLNAGNVLSVPIFLCYSKTKIKQSRSTSENPNEKNPRALQPICSISVYYPDRGQPIAEGHEVLEKTIGGASADVNLFGRISTFITFKRGLLYGHTPAITDLVIIGKEQSPPPGFKKLNMNLNKGIVGPKLYICYKIAIVKPPSKSYNASILSRYPKTNYEDFPLPDSSPLFCLPLGVCVEHWDSNGQFPLPTFSTFILTNSFGAKMYGSAVTFYEQISSTYESLPQMREHLGLVDNNKAPLYMSKCICLLSRWPFFSAFKVFLSSLYRISISPGTTLPIERYILNLMSDVPFPSISRPRVMMEIGSEQLVFTLPVKTPLPVSISNHWSLVNSLDADNCITLFSLLLLEQKVILHSSRPSLLSCVGEALTSVLFPFQWQCPYIPMCPLSLSVYTQAPMSFIIGIDSRYFDHYETPDDVCVVDLDCNTISIPSVIKKYIDDRPLPLKAKKVLFKGLKAIGGKLQCMMVDSDLAVELAPLDYAEIESRNSLDQIDINVREVFLRFNAIIFGNYPSCLCPMVTNMSESARDAKNLFDQAKFLKKCALIDHAFYKSVFNTQMFINFVEQRSFSYSTDTTLAFFDECTEKLSHDPHAKLIKPLAESEKQPDVTIVAPPPHGIGLEHDKKYTYDDGFPVLDHNLFIAPEQQQQQQPTSPNADNAKNDSSLITVRSTAERTKGKLTAETAHGNAEPWAKTLLAEIYCLWFIHFPGFLKYDWNKRHHLEKAFNVLEDMHKIGAIPNDEVCYRVLMEQCVKLWKPYMAVKVFTEMRKVNVNPNAVTYGIYNRALIDCNCPISAKSRWRAVFIVICTCLYLYKRIASHDALDGVSKQQLMRWNSYDEAIDKTFPVRTDSQSSSNSSGKGNGSPKLQHTKRNRAASVSKVFTRFGKDKKNRKVSNQDLEKMEESIPEEKPLEKDEGYTVKRGNSKKQDKSSQNKLTTDSPDSFEKRNASFSNSKRTRSRGPPRMSMYTRRFDNIMPNSRSSGRMQQVSSHKDPNDININITSCTECNNCQRLVYDEDIMSNWSALDSDYNTHCPYCGHPFVAQLVIQLQQHQVQPHSPEIHNTPVKSTNVSKIPEESSPTPPTRHKRGEIHNTPAKSTNVSKIPEESSPTPPTRHKRGVKIPKQDSKSSSGESSASGSPKNIKQGNTSSTDSSPLLVAKQDVPSSSEASPLVNRMMKMSTDDESATSQNKDTTDNETHLGTKQQVTPTLSGNGPIIGTFADDILKQINSKQTTSDYYSCLDICSAEDPGPSCTAAKPTTTVAMDITDSIELAKMKSRGHARVHSAPLVLDEEKSSDKIPVTSLDVMTTSSVDKHQNTNSKGDGDKAVKENKVAPPIVVHYLNPLVLRKEVESLLIREGLSYLECKDFPTLSPTVYWNLVWYFTRLGLSSYLPHQALDQFSEFIENKRQNLTINLLWDCIANVHDPPLYRLWKDRTTQTFHPIDTTGPLLRRSVGQLQSLAAGLQCWRLLPAAISMLRDRKVEQQTNTGGPHRGLYHDLALFCSCLRQGSLDMERFDIEYRDMLQQLPKDVQPLLRKEDEMPSAISNACRMFFNTLYVV